MIRAISQRLRRLETALTPVEPQILTITAIASATGKVINEHHLVMYPPNHRSRQTRYWKTPAQAVPHDRR
jgi:hypothetical protein